MSNFEATVVRLVRDADHYGNHAEVATQIVEMAEDMGISDEQMMARLKKACEDFL